MSQRTKSAHITEMYLLVRLSDDVQQMHISCQSYLPTPSGDEPPSSKSHETLRAVTEWSEEAHHGAEFHTGRWAELPSRAGASLIR